MKHPHLGSDEFLDYYRAFFQACWHLKDWTKNDSRVPATTRASIESEAHAEPTLKIVADLANGTKHLASRSHAGRPGADEISLGVSIQMDAVPVARHLLRIKAADGRDLGDAIDIAERAISAWRGILERAFPQPAQ